MPEATPELGFPTRCDLTFETVFEEDEFWDDEEDAYVECMTEYLVISWNSPIDNYYYERYYDARILGRRTAGNDFINSHIPGIMRLVRRERP